MRLGFVKQVLMVLTLAVFVTSVCPKMISCWKKWLKMTDDNYLKALERYDSCGRLVNEMKGTPKDRYKKSLMENLQKSSNYFINHTEMAPADVIRVLHRANRLAESWTRINRKTRTPEYPALNCCNGDAEEEEDQTSLTALRWYFWWKFLFYSFIVLIVLQGSILLVLFCRVSCSNMFIKLPNCPLQVVPRE